MTHMTPTTRDSVRPALWGAAFVLLVLLLVLGLWFAARPGPQLQAGAEALQQKLDALQAEFADEREARLLLASEVDFLRQVLLEFGEELQLGRREWQAPDAELALAGSPDDEGELPDGEGGGADDESEAAAGDPATSETPIFKLERLIAAGVDALEAERVRDVWHQAELEKLELRDSAVREGWVQSKRFKRQLDRIRRQTRNDLGECGYDSLLYGTGKTNRVVVRDVLVGSTAALAGLQPGDVVMRYDDKRVFAGSDLQKATSRGTKGETIVVDVERNGETIYMNLERGPIGMFMRQTRVAPSGC